MKKKVNVTLDPALHAKVKSAAPLRGLNVEKAYDAALRTWLNEPAPVVPAPAPPPYEPANIPLHDKLERILNSGDIGTIRAVVPNIEIFYDRLKPSRAGREASAAEIRRRSDDLDEDVIPPRKRAGGK